MNAQDMVDIANKARDQIYKDLGKRIDRLCARKFAPFRVLRLRRILRILASARPV